MKTKNIKEKIKEYFLQNPTIQLRVRQIERELKAPLPSVIRYTKELEKEDILKKTKVANITVFSANRAAKNYLREKRVWNINQVYKSGCIDTISEELSNPTIVLFGSYSKGEDTEESDIDLYIETVAKKRIDTKKYEKLLKRKIQIFMYQNIQEVENKELANNILNGILLNGYLEVLK